MDKVNKQGAESGKDKQISHLLHEASQERTPQGGKTEGDQ